MPHQKSSFGKTSKQKAHPAIVETEDWNETWCLQHILHLDLCCEHQMRGGVGEDKSEDAAKLLLRPTHLTKTTQHQKQGSLQTAWNSDRNEKRIHVWFQLEQLSGRAAAERKEMEERHTLVQGKVGPRISFPFRWCLRVLSRHCLGTWCFFSATCGLSNVNIFKFSCKFPTNFLRVFGVTAACERKMTYNVDTMSCMGPWMISVFCFRFSIFAVLNSYLSFTVRKWEEYFSFPALF